MTEPAGYTDRELQFPGRIQWQCPCWRRAECREWRVDVLCLWSCAICCLLWCSQEGCPASIAHTQVISSIFIYLISKKATRPLTVQYVLQNYETFTIYQLIKMHFTKAS